MASEDNGKISKSRQLALRDVGQRFGIVSTVSELQRMMKEVTKKEVNSDTVNAACNCVQNINLTVKTAIQAAKFLSLDKE